MSITQLEREFPNVVHGQGPQVWYFFDDFNGITVNESLDTVSAVGIWTLAESSTAATELHDLTVTGGVLKITQAATDNDVVSLIANSGIKVSDLKAGEPIFFGVRFKTDDADDVDLHIGLGIHDTSYQASEPAGHCTFRLVEASAGLDLVARKDGTSTTADNIITIADDTWVRAFFKYTPSATTDIGDLEYVVHSNGTVQSGTIGTAGNFPDDVVIFPVIQVQNGAAAADTTSIDWIYAFATRADYVDGTG